MQTIVLGLAWFIIANAGASLFSWLLASTSMQPDRTRRMVLIRLFPAGSSILFAGVIFLPTHLMLEPPDANESLGLLWYLLAACGTFLLGRSASRVVSLWRAGRELLRAGSRAAGGTAGVHEVEGISGVSLAGVFKPRILIGPDVGRALTPAELAVAIAHELAHRDACDNVTRASMLCAPDLFGGSRRAGRLEKAWHEAAESLADSRAVGGDRVRAVHLASALVKVARLSASAAARPQPAWSTLNDPSLLERRVRRLVSGALAPAMPYGHRVGATLIAAGGIFLAGIPLTGGSVHRLTEYLVQLLP
jgi:beta-lactamase regulating signal transducer with metallopeptidase domain